MAYYSPQQKQTTGKWHYTCQNGACIFEVGFCNECEGHDSPGEATEHYRQYKLSQSEIKIDDECQKKCEICSAWTQSYRTYGDSWWLEHYYFCDEHLGVKFLDELTVPKKKVKSITETPKQYEGYQPNDFDEAVNYLVNQKYNTGDHFGSGMALRNDWGLWYNETPLAKWFTGKRLYHGDDRSGLLSKAVEAKIKGENFDLDSEIKFYQEWWEKQYGPEHSLENMEKQFFKNLDEDDE